MIDKIKQNYLREKFNPDSSDIRIRQLRMVEMIKHLDAICKKYNIHYWLSSGTCLGAIRHGGFIPWDDDMDIEMFWEDYKKLEKVFNETEDYVLQTWKYDKFYTLPFAKMRDKNTIIYNSLYKHAGIFIDIFIIEKIPTSISLTSLKFSGILQNLYKKVKENKTRNNKIKFIITKTLVFRLVFPICRLISKIINKFQNSDYRHTYGCSWVNNIRKKEEICSSIRIDFEGLSLPVPANYDSYLTRIYGNYMELPKENDIQIQHADFLKYR